MSTARDEVLETGRIGEAGALLLYRTVWSVAVGRNFPPPTGSQGWDRSAVTETAHDFLDGERGIKRITDVVVRSVDDRSFERLLEGSVLNFLRDQSRRTDMGKLILRVTEILRDESAFDLVPGSPSRWTLAAGDTAPSVVRPDSLARAMVGVEVVVPAWASEHRDSPLADRDSFIRLLVAVLTAAEGSLTSADVAHVIATRLDHRRIPLTMELDVLEHISEPDDGRNPATMILGNLRGQELFNQLSDRERILVATIERSVRDLGSVLAVGKSQASLLRQRLSDWLQAELGDDDDAEQTTKALFGLCESWLHDRTELHGATFANDVRHKERGRRR